MTSTDILLIAAFGWLLWRERHNPDVWRICLAVGALLVVVHWRMAGGRDWLAELSDYVAGHLWALT